MSVHIVQSGRGVARPLVLGFLVGANLDTRLRDAFGPDPCIMTDSTGGPKGPRLGELVAFARRFAGFERVSRLALIGYSAGCQRVRAMYLDGVRADAYLLVDGTHANLPPEGWQIAWLRDIAAEARAGRVLLVATHTLQTYVERLYPPSSRFASTIRVLRMATGFDLDDAGPLHAPLVTRQGQLWVFSYASGTADAPAHVAQHDYALPMLAATHVGPWLARPSSATQASSSRSGGSGGLGLGLGLLAAGALLNTGRKKG